MNIYNLRFEEGMEKALEDDLLCNDLYCPWFINHMSSPSCPTCEGRFCEAAYVNYIEDQEYETPSV